MEDWYIYPQIFAHENVTNAHKSVQKSSNISNVVIISTETNDEKYGYSYALWVVIDSHGIMVNCLRPPFFSHEGFFMRRHLVAKLNQIKSNKTFSRSIHMLKLLTREVNMRMIRISMFRYCQNICNSDNSCSQNEVVSFTWAWRANPNVAWELVCIRNERSF